ncbi:MAG: YraN family protein [Paludibacter sp.]|nr:YraN family protein [Paludibacter sp.]
MTPHHQLGKSGEELAKAFLVSKDYAIRATNLFIGKLEIDIIAEKDGILIIVEVRTRSTDWYMQPEASVDYRKMKHLTQAAQGYVKLIRWKGETRFDVIAIVTRPDGSFRIDHFEDAFQPVF